MEQKNNKGLYIVIGVLIFLVLVLIGLVVVLALRGFSGLDDKELAGEKGNKTAVEVMENSGDAEDDEDFGEELEETEKFETYSAQTHYVVGGYEFTVPGDYDLLYNELVGTVVYMEDVFQMKTAVVDNSYEEVMKNPADLTQGSLDAGGTILQDIKETEVNGKKYAYYRVDLSGDECFVVYTAAPGADKRIAAQIALQKDNIEDEDMLQMFDSIAGSAVQTDKPDSTFDDIMEQIDAKIQSEIHGEVKEESTMKIGKQEVKHKVSSGFYTGESYEESDYVVEYYYADEPRVDVKCYLYSSGVFAGVEDYIEVSKHLEKTCIKTMEVEGHTVYYVVEEYEDDGDEIQWLYAGCDLGDGAFYVIDVYVSNEDIDLSMKTIRDFLVLN